MQPEFNLTEGQRLKENGMALAINHADDKWKALFRTVGTSLALSGNEVTSEDILDKVGMPLGSSNALGATMNGLVRALGLKRVGYKQAKRRSCHAAIVGVWQLPS